MTERERWIVYPLLFLALGAALRDKVIKTTQSQRIKCQGLYVVDKDENPILILGAEQFPELRVDAPDLLRVDAVESLRISGNRIIGNDVLSDRVSSKRYVVSEGNTGVQLDARHAVVAVQLLDWVHSIAQQLQALKQLQLQQQQKGAVPGSAPPTPEAQAVPADGAPEQSAPSPPSSESDSSETSHDQPTPEQPADEQSAPGESPPSEPTADASPSTGSPATEPQP